MIFPKEFLEDTYPLFSSKREKRSKAIYAIFLLSLFLGLSLLPLIKTEIYFSSRGIVRSSKERSQIVSPKSGFTEYSSISYNRKVQRGDTLLIINSRNLNDQISELERKMTIELERIDDLNYLLFAQNPNTKNVITPAFRSDLAKYLQRLQRIKLDVDTKKRILKRQQILYKSNVISEAEYEQFLFEYQFSQQERALFMQEKKAQWDDQRKILQDQVNSYQNELTYLNNSKPDYILTSKIKGTLFSTQELQKGTFINQGEVLAEISPISDLLVEIYVPSNKAGLLRPNQQIIYQIDAFNYRNWGQATGMIIDIADDVEIINNQPVFKVLASLEEEKLALKNGTAGKITKGLTLSSKFILTERTLFDLLYDKVDDWLNPNRTQRNLTASK